MIEKFINPRKNIAYIFILGIILLFIFNIISYYNSLEFKLSAFIGDNTNIGVSVIKDNEIVTINNEKYPLMSVFKYFVAIKVLKQLEDQQIPLSEKIKIKENLIDKNTHSPLLKKYSNFPIEITIAELLRYMIIKSDNNACDILIEYTGGIESLQEFVYDLGFNNIEILVNEKTMNKDISKQYLNKAYPIDVVKAMKFIKESSFLSDTSKDFLDKTLAQTETGKDKLKKGLPSNITLYHKTGSGSINSKGLKIADNDAGYIVLPNGKIYYIAVFIKDSKPDDNINAGTISTISEIVYKHYANDN